MYVLSPFQLFDHYPRTGSGQTVWDPDSGSTVNGQVIKNLPICLGQVAIEIAACNKIHIIYEIICSCGKTSKIENNAECSDEIDPP